ncbi:MAG TPA: hypothetical protein VFG22_18025, partial [Polyangiales bacterium]|nr:hypothetical protein [Polyangiales bacterium]
PVISSVSTFGSILRVIFNAPPNPEAGVYDVVIQVCNACGSWDIPIRLEVVDPVIIPTTDCGLSQATFPPSATPMDVGDQILAFRAGACITVDPVLPPDVCATLGAFPEFPLAPVTDRVVVVDGVNNCKLVPADDFLQGLTLCAQIENLITDDIEAGDQVVAFRPGAPNVCVRGSGFDMVCSALQALAPLAGSPTTLVVGTDGGICGTLDLATLYGLLNIPPAFDGGTIANPIEGPDGSCAAPTYSFTTDPTSGLLYEAGVPAVTLGYSNCSAFVRVGDVVRIEASNSDFIEVGASVIADSENGFVTLRGGSAAPGANCGLIVETNAIERLRIGSQGAWNLNAGGGGNLGDIITSQGPGLPPAWAPPAPVALACPVYLPCDGSYAGPSYSWGSRPEAGFLMLDSSIAAPKIGVALEGIRFARMAIDDFNFDQYRRTFQLFGEQTLSTNVFPRWHVTQFYNGHVNHPSIWMHLHSENAIGTGMEASSAALGNNAGYFAFNNDPALGVNGSRNELNTSPGAIGLYIGNSPIANPNRIFVRLEDRVGPITLFQIARDETLNELNITINEGFDGAAAAAGTLTNAPAAGDPTFWLRVTINGVQRFIPAW